MRKNLKHLGFGSLVHSLTLLFRDLPDRRQKSKVKHSIHDVVMSGFAMMYFQDPSLLQFQKRLEEDQHNNNLRTLFHVETIPEDSQMRDILDGLSPEEFRPVFKNYVNRLQRGNQLEQYQFIDGSYLCAVDGTQYFSSEKIHCDSCLEKHRDDIRYSHEIVQAAIVNPKLKQVIPIMPSEIRNIDGTLKQDCEINAAKRFVSNLRKDHPRMKLTIVADGLYSKQPMIEAIRAEDMGFILVAKPDDHKIMMEWVEEQKKLGEVKTKKIEDDKGRCHIYEWINEVPLNGRQDSANVNYFSYRLLSPKGEANRTVSYKNSWVTDFKVTSENINELVAGGRSRWKIENECFNTLKNQGYHIEHSYGHGKKNLCHNFLLLTLMAFFCHQIAELTDELFKKCREKIGRKTELWAKIRTSIQIFFFDSWEMLFEFTYNPKAFKPTLIKPG